MTISGNWFASAMVQAFAGHINWGSDAIKCALMGSGYTPNLSSQVHWSDISANEATGTGYTAGGQTLTSKTLASTTGTAWGTAWAASTGYLYGAVVRPATANGYLYLCSTAGTSGSSAPTWPTVQGETVADGTAVWTCLGESITQWGSAAPTWPASTINAYAAVIYDAQSGTPSTEPLVACINFGGEVSTSGTTFEVQPSALGWVWWVPG